MGEKERARAVDERNEADEENRLPYPEEVLANEF